MKKTKRIFFLVVFAATTAVVFAQTTADVDKVIQDATRMISASPNDPRGYRARGNAYLFKDEYDKGIADYTQAIKLDPGNAESYSKRGFGYFYKRDYTRARTDFEKALQLASGDTLTRELLVKIYLDQGQEYTNRKDYDQAIDVYTLAIGLEPNNPEAFAKRGFSYYFRKDPSPKEDLVRSCADLERALQINDNRDVRSILSLIKTQLEE
jgi:tetratricopeptide (TPR) repeat protein